MLRPSNANVIAEIRSDEAIRAPNPANDIAERLPEDGMRSCVRSLLTVHSLLDLQVRCTPSPPGAQLTLTP